MKYFENESIEIIFKDNEILIFLKLKMKNNEMKIDEMKF